MTNEMKEIIATGFAIGNNAINEAVQAGTTQELLSKELNQLRYAAIFVLSSLMFNEDKQMPGNLDSSLESHVLIIKQTIADLQNKFTRGELMEQNAGQPPVKL